MNNQNKEINKDEVKELLLLYGYMERTENVFLKEFNECQILVRYFGNVFEFKVKTHLVFPTEKNDSIQITVNTLHPEKIDLSKIEDLLLTLFQQITDFIEQK